MAASNPDYFSKAPLQVPQYLVGGVSTYEFQDTHLQYIRLNIFHFLGGVSKVHRLKHRFLNFVEI